MTDEHLKDIESRLSLLPRKLFVKETHVPRMIKDKATGRPIPDPRSGSSQSRVDIIEVDDPAERPWIHLHQYPDHVMYVQNALAVANAIAGLIDDSREMFSEIKKLKRESNAST